MITSLDEWLVFLRGSQALIGFPLIVGGLGLMLFGSRMWKMCMMLSFALIGAGVGAVVVGPGDFQLTAAIGAGAVLGFLSYWLANLSVALLGGLIGCALVTQSLGALGLRGMSLLGASALTLFACSALAYINRRLVTVVITAFLGASLALSGVAVFAMRMPGLYGTVDMLTHSYGFMLPFMVLVPTVMSCLYQEAEVRRHHSGV